MARIETCIETSPGLFRRVVQRGVDRQACFFTGTDRVLYLEELAELATDEDCMLACYSYIEPNPVRARIPSSRTSSAPTPPRSRLGRAC